MRCLLLALLLVGGLAPLEAQSPFNGVWKIDIAASPPSTTIDTYLVQGGRYRCSTCDPPLDLSADGHDHRIAGEPCYDSVRLQILDPRTTLETDSKSGKPVATTRITVSADGNSATLDWSESCNAKGDTVSGSDRMTRVAPGPPGSHPVSGSWQIAQRANSSENALQATLKLEGDTFSFSDPTGQGYTARLDGTETPLQGDLAHTRVSLHRVDNNTIEETDKQDGKVVGVTRFTLSAGGKKLTVTMRDRLGHTRTFVCYKQGAAAP